jgi:hypothetical protein
MHKYYNILIILSSLIIVVTCKKDDKNYYSAKVVVESYLAPNQPVNVHITKEILYTSTDTTQTIDNLTIEIICNNIHYSLTSIGSGNYTSDTSLHIIIGNTYKLEFEYNNSIISASTIIPSKPKGFTQSATSIVVQQFNPGSTTMPTFPDPLELDWDNSNHDYYIIVVKNIESTLVPTDTVNSNRPAFRTQPTQSNIYKIQAMQFKYYGTHNIILYKLNPEYAALYNDNGSNSLNLSSPVSNINNGLGIFTGIDADTLTIEVNK